ncbi:alpha/beta fold hydrolase [Nocardia cyriacigeorgica]|uniref:alpha/beta fold hydrolase n=1 Tax=Nocardia cyriacigeorgica TaxID=135487 RepID=UPI00189490E5|nr:alpha/beta fold hydrolase [Nocardia cyriacigeorgica]MBF6435083.1 alpha/beta fold hydrolase [Nocardia cyriacigeorgica]
MNVPEVRHGFVDVDGVQVFYREAGPADGTTLLLLHGFPSASHQYRRLMDALGGRYRLIAPDYPGFGHTETPDGFVYSFDVLADTVEGFVQRMGLDRFVLYAFDFGGPIGLRLATRHPEWIAGLIVQNANAYEEGLSELARNTINAAADELGDLFTLPVTRSQYEGGTSDPSLVSPDGWTLDQHFLDLPGRKDAQLALALDYRSNVELYPTWQAWLRRHQPPTLIIWGRGDAFFPEPGAHAYRRDLPDAELHILDTGHFALEDKLPDIVALIDRFLRNFTMKIAVIGATGNLGGAIAREATARGHRVSALSSADLDVRDPDSIRAAVAGHDAVVASVKGSDHLVPKAASALIEAGVRRLLFIGGGGSLLAPNGQRFVDSPSFPAQYRETALDQADALDILRRDGAAVDWTYLSPPPMHLIPGERTGVYRTEAGDTPVTDANGDSRITIGDLASAAVDTLERNAFLRQRITVGY